MIFGKSILFIFSFSSGQVTTKIPKPLHEITQARLMSDTTSQVSRLGFLSLIYFLRRIFCFSLVIYNAEILNKFDQY